MSMALETEILFRLSLAIDEGKGFPRMPRDLSLQALRLLGGIAAFLLECDPRDARTDSTPKLEPHVVLPLRYEQTMEFRAFWNAWEGDARTCPPVEGPGWVEVEAAGLTFVVFDLAGFGYWVLVFAASSPPGTFLGDMIPLANRLSSACLQNRREGELHRGRIRTELALAQGDMGIWEWDLVRGSLLWDPRIREIHGVLGEEARTIPEWISLICPEDRKGAQLSILEARERRTSFKYMTLYPQGGERHLEGWGGPVRDANGDIRSVVGILVDVTTQTRQERELGRLSRLERILTQLAISLLQTEGPELRGHVQSCLEVVGEFVSADRVYTFVYDFERRVASNNHEWCRDGIEPQIEQLQDVPLEDFTWWTEAHEAGLPVLIEDVGGLPRADPAREILCAQGIQSLLAIPMMNGASCMGFVGFDAVLARRSWNQSEIRLLTVLSELLSNAQLKIERQARIREAEKALEASVAESQRLARKAQAESEAKSSFINVLSHEIQTPLTGLLGFIELLGETPMGAVQESYLESIRKSGVLLMATTDRVLDLARLEAGKVELETLPFSPGKAVVDAAAIYLAIAEEKGLKLTSRVSERVPGGIPGDAVRVQQALGNLVSNAIKFTHEGYVLVWADVLPPGSGPPQTLVLGVEDSGVGFEVATSNQLTEAFRQGSISTYREHGGSGLGLAIVHEIARLMRGGLHISSQLGVGSRIWIEIPFETVDAGDVPAPGDRSGSVPGAPPGAAVDRAPPFPGLRVLLAEDSREGRELLLAQLRVLGAESVAFDSGVGVAEALGSASFDLIIMDCHMPRLNGFELLAALQQRAASEASLPPVVAMSADISAATSLRAMELGARCFLRKPHSLTELEAAIRHCLD